MLRLKIGDDDTVLVCMPVRSGPVRLMQGTTVVPCMECDRGVWKAPGLPLVRWNKDGHLVPNHLRIEPTVILCIPCARMHQLSAH